MPLPAKPRNYKGSEAPTQTLKPSFYGVLMSRLIIGLRSPQEPHPTKIIYELTYSEAEFPQEPQNAESLARVDCCAVGGGGHHASAVCADHRTATHGRGQARSSRA